MEYLFSCERTFYPFFHHSTSFLCIGGKFAFRSTDINEIKQTLEFFSIDKEDENNQKRLVGYLNDIELVV